MEKKLKSVARFHKLSDSFSLLEKADDLWKRLTYFYKIAKIFQISIVLYGLHHSKSSQINLLDSLEELYSEETKKKSINLKTIDHINSRFGRDSITIGALPREMFEFSGTKVAFTRIPEIKEFYE